MSSAPIRQVRWARRIIALLAVVGALATSVPTAAAQTRIDLRQFYPNFEMVESGQYLEGFNYISGSPARSVLWFERGSEGRFKQYNWAPTDAQATCHWDELQWRRGRLRYHTTHDGCGAVERETTYTPAVELMPRRWREGRSWNRSGRSDVTHSEDGRIVCRGVTEWSASVLGWEEIHPGVEAIHVRSRQTTIWTEGQSESGCAVGYITPWQEDYYLMPDLPIDGGGTAPAFKRSVGGNLAGGPDQWNVWFDRWASLPE